MVSELFFYQLALCALLWLCLMCNRTLLYAMVEGNEVAMLLQRKSV